MDDSYQAKLWRTRFTGYNPRELVKYMASSDPDIVMRVAAEVLDEKLAQIGCDPVRG